MKDKFYILLLAFVF